MRDVAPASCPKRDLTAMMPNLLALLKPYLIPFAIAIPLVLLIFIFSMRRPANRKIADIADQPPMNTPRATGEVRVAAAQSVDIAVGETTRFVAGAQGAAGAAAAPDVDLELDRPSFSDTSPPKLAEQITVLVVDDSAVPRTKLRKLFEGQGFLVETASDGVEALDKIAKTRVSVVVTDLEMPTMDGFELIAAIQGSIETEDIPIIAITGHEELQARVHDISGLFGIFKKPWNDREIIKRVEALALMSKRSSVH